MSTPTKPIPQNPLRWMDAHCHLSDETFDGERKSLYAELIENNITGLVLAGTEPRDWTRQTALDLPQEIRVARVFGLHPWWVEEFSEGVLSESLQILNRSLKDCQGLGELGLDYHRAKTTEQRSKQRFWFEAQLKLAKTSDLPVVLHIVRAHHEALPILRKQRHAFRGLIHAYWANLETAKSYIDLGFLLSIPPRIMKEDPHQLLSKIDPEFIVFETDTPFFDAEKNCVRPVLIHDMLEFAAKARGEDLKETVTRQARLLCELFPILRD